MKLTNDDINEILVHIRHQLSSFSMSDVTSITTMLRIGNKILRVRVSEEDVPDAKV